MRAAVVLLILVNLALFGYARLDRAAQSEPGRLVQQVQPERIRLLSAAQVAALGPSKVAAVASVCVAWGPFAEADRVRAEADLEPLSSGRLVSRQQPGTPSMIVVRDPSEAVVQRMKALEAQYVGTAVKAGPCAPAS